jgi:hypothetical protein
MVYYLMCVPFSFPRLDPTFFFLSFLLVVVVEGTREPWRRQPVIYVFV